MRSAAEVHIGELAHAGGEVLCRAPVGDLHLAPRPVRVEEDEQVDRPIAFILAVVALDLTRLGGDRLPYLADELGRALIETNYRALRIGCFGIEVEHILHAGDVFAIDLRNTPHILAPRLEVILGQAPTHGLSGYAVVFGELDHRASQQVQRPAGAPLGRARTGSCHQEGFLFAQELASRSGARLFGQRRLQIAFNEAALDPVHSRAANANAGRDVFIARPSIRGQQNLRALELARRVLASAQKRREFAALGLVEFHPVAYIHRRLLMVEARTNG